MGNTFFVGFKTVKIAFSSDIHLDINNLPVDAIIAAQAAYLRSEGIDYYFIAGDTFNDFRLTEKYVADLQAELSTTTVKFLAGNHDMLRGITYEQLESPVTDAYFHNQFVDLPGTNWRIVGNNGWYDYSFADQLHRSADRFWHWKRAYWADGQIEQPMNDFDRETIVLQQMKEQFDAAQLAHKRVGLVTHFVPHQHFIRYTNDDRFFNMANGMLGSRRLEETINQYHIPLVVFGHVHRRFAPITIKDTRYYNPAVGYNAHRHNEWQTNDFLSEWHQQTKIIEFF